MANLDGIGANFVNVNSLYKTGKKANENEAQSLGEAEAQKSSLAGVDRKNPTDILNSMHNYGVQNFIAPKIAKMESDPQMKQRIGDFMASFEDEVQKGLQIISQEFPSMDSDL
jgi:hypothetical protein